MANGKAGGFSLPLNPALALREMTEAEGKTSGEPTPAPSREAAPVPTPPDEPAAPTVPRRQVMRRPVKRTKPSSVAQDAPTASTDPAPPAAPDNFANKITNKLDKKLINKKVILLTNYQNNKTGQNCTRTEIESALEKVNDLAASTEKQVGSRCGALLWNAVSNIKGDDPYKPLKTQDVFEEAIKLRILFDELGINVKDFLGE